MPSFLFFSPALLKCELGWLYSGMAFRMAFDLGIHLPSDKLQAFVKSLSTEDIEIRKRLFWSCYTWDKTISIYLGRMPNFLPDTDGVPLNFSKHPPLTPLSNIKSIDRHCSG
jgi:hypothetical protein